MADSQPPDLTRSRTTLEAELEQVLERARTVEFEVLIASTPGSTGRTVRELESEWTKLDTYLGELLKRSFSTQEVFQEYQNSLSIRMVTDDPGTHLAAVEEHVREMRDFCEGLEQRLHFFEPATEATVDKPPDPAPIGSAVLLVHGRDHAMRDSVRIFLEGLDAEVTVLEDTPNMGRHLIEKFEDETDKVDFVVALASGDDEGRLRIELANENEVPTMEARARQNVIFEIGYAFGRLGRGRSAVIHGRGVRMPSDVDGLAYIPYSGDWKIRLARELNAGGLPLSFERIVE